MNLDNHQQLFIAEIKEKIRLAQYEALPIVVATYQTTNTLPAEYQSLLPSANTISQKLQFLNANNNELQPAEI